MKNPFHIIGVLGFLMSGGMLLSAGIVSFYLSTPKGKEAAQQRLIKQVGPIIQSQIKNALPGIGGSPSNGTSSLLSIPSTTGPVMPVNK